MYMFVFLVVLHLCSAQLLIHNPRHFTTNRATAGYWYKKHTPGSYLVFNPKPLPLQRILHRDMAREVASPRVRYVKAR